MNIRFDYPLWFLILCLVLGAALALILYYKNRKDDLPFGLSRFLAVVRFITVALVSFLLLSPVIRSVTRSFEKPLVIVALDNTQSVGSGKDSVFYQTGFQESLQNVLDELSRDYDLRVYSFSSSMKRMDEPGFRLDFSGQQTNLSVVFDEVENAYPNRNIGAVVVASDGIYNSGLNPVYSSRNLRAPLYTIALGDTSVQKDVILARVNYNRVAYLGNRFPVEVIVKAQKFKGNRSRVSISRGDSVLFSQIIDFTGDHFTHSVIAELPALESGLQRYRVLVSGLPGEFTLLNNTTELFVEVLNSRQKILLLFNSPHPDVSAIKSAIFTNDNYDVEDFPVGDFRNDLAGYNLVILHQLPSKNQIHSIILQKIMDSKLPVLYIIGNQTDINALNRLNKGLAINPEQAVTNEALPFWNPEFNLFQIDEDTREKVTNFPPLVCPFGEYKVRPSSSVLFFQKIGRVTTTMPLILFSEDQDNKTGTIAGEGIWKWRLANFAHNENHQAFNQIILKTIQYLAVTEEKGFFRVSVKSSYLENEPVEFDAEVYNKSFEPISEPDVEIVIENEEGAKFPFAFARKGKTYHLVAGNFPPGNYSYHARVTVGEDLYEKRGAFSVEALNVEKVNMVADYTLMYTLANRHDGRMLMPAELDQLPDLLASRDDIHTVIYNQKNYNELNSVFWILILILALLATEWFIRKYKGSY